MAHDFFVADPRPVNVRQVWKEISLFLVAQDQFSVGVIEDESVGDGVDGVLQALLAFPERNFGPRAFADVVIFRHSPDAPSNRPQ